MPEWKVISQRQWLKGLSATYGLFAQPSGILTRLSNLVYDRRGALRTSDGSYAFTALNGQPQAGAGAIIELALYSPPGANAYYVGVEKSAQNLGAPSTLTATPLSVGGAISSLTRSASGIVTLVTSAAHNLAALYGSGYAFNFNPGNLVVSGAGDASYNGVIAFNRVNIVNATTITYPQGGAAGSTSGGALGTQLAAGTYSYDVTANDGLGGETPATGAPATVTLSGSQNAVLLSWRPGTNDFAYSAYGVSANRLGRLNPGPGAGQLILQPSWADLGLLGQAAATPPTVNNTQSCVVYRMDCPSYMTTLASLPPYLLPQLGGIGGAVGGYGGAYSLTVTQPSSMGARSLTRVVWAVPPEGGGSAGSTGGSGGSGSGGGAGSSGTVAAPSAGSGPTALGGVAGAISPLPQMVAFAGSLIFALGNGYPPQMYTDPAAGDGLFKAIPNKFSSAYPDWQPNVAWNQGDMIHESTTNGIYTATQGGVSGANRPGFVATVNAVTADNTVAWTCSAAAYVGTPLRGAAHACVYAGALWLANTWPVTTADNLDGPNCIKMCDVNNPQSWNPINIAFLAKDDGDQITGLATFTIAESGIAPTGSLVVFKHFSTFQISGVFGASDFSIQQAQTDLGCIAPRSIQFAPGYGIMRMTHLGVAYFNGVSDKLISEEIRPYLFGGADDIQPVDWNYIYFAKSAQSANPPMYLLAAPVLAYGVSGATLAAGSAGATYTLYARISMLQQQSDGTWSEIGITPEQKIASGSLAVTATTPAAVSGIAYRVYLGLAPGSESGYQQAPSFAGTVVNLAGLTAGTPNLSGGALTRIFGYDLVQRTWAVIDLPFPISALKQIRFPGTVPITVAGGWNDGQLRRLFAGDATWDTGQQVAWSLTAAEIFQQGGSGKVYFRRLVIRGEEALNTAISVTVTLGGAAQTPLTAKQRNLGADQWKFEIDILRDATNAHAQVNGTGPMALESLDWHVKPKASGAPVSVQR